MVQTPDVIQGVWFQELQCYRTPSMKFQCILVQGWVDWGIKLEVNCMGKCWVFCPWRCIGWVGTMTPCSLKNQKRSVLICPPKSVVLDWLTCIIYTYICYTHVKKTCRNIHTYMCVRKYICSVPYIFGDSWNPSSCGCCIETPGLIFKKNCWIHLIGRNYWAFFAGGCARSFSHE